MLAKERIDGLLLFPTFINKIKEALENQMSYTIPIVLCGSSGKNLITTDFVKCDNKLGAFYAIEHLIENGYKKLPVFFRFMIRSKAKADLPVIARRLKSTDFVLTKH